MKDYLSFFERFREINSVFGNHHSYFYRDWGSDWSFIHFMSLRQIIKDKELLIYSSLLYATNLLSQIVYTYFPDAEILNNSDKISVFPKICGILSTAYSPVCPSVPSTVVIYCTQTTDLDGYANWDRTIERKTWNANFIDFVNSVRWANSNLENLLPYLTSSILNDIDLREIQLKMFEEHKRINDEINGVAIGNFKRRTNG
jgi:hypothetical protein